MRFDFDISGDVQISRELLRFGNRATGAKPAFESIYKDLLSMEKEQFDSQGKYASGGWPALKQATEDAKASAGLDPRILHATLALRRSLTESSDQNQLKTITDSLLIFGSRLEYAVFHQFGTVKMDQRRPVEIRLDHRKNIMKKLQRWVVKGKL